MMYAVVWSENGAVPRAGSLELEHGALRLPGCELAYGDVVDVQIDRRPTLRLAGRATLVIESVAGDTLRIASLDGAGTLHELVERLQSSRRSS